MNTCWAAHFSMKSLYYLILRYVILFFKQLVSAACAVVSFIVVTQATVQPGCYSPQQGAWSGSQPTTQSSRTFLLLLTPSEPRTNLHDTDQSWTPLPPGFFSTFSSFLVFRFFFVNLSYCHPCSPCPQPAPFLRQHQFAVAKAEVSRACKSHIDRLICIDMQTSWLPIETADSTQRRVCARVRAAVSGSYCFNSFWMIHTYILEAWGSRWCSCSPARVIYGATKPLLVSCRRHSQRLRSLFVTDWCTFFAESVHVFWRRCSLQPPRGTLIRGWTRKSCGGAEVHWLALLCLSERRRLRYDDDTGCFLLSVWNWHVLPSPPHGPFQTLVQTCAVSVKSASSKRPEGMKGLQFLFRSGTRRIDCITPCFYAGLQKLAVHFERLCTTPSLNILSKVQLTCVWKSHDRLHSTLNMQHCQPEAMVFR